MVSAGNIVIGTLNLLLLAIAIAVMVEGFSYQTSFKTEKTCEKSVEIPLLIIGASLFCVSLLGFITCCDESNMLFAIYSFIGFAVIVGLIAFTIVSLFMTDFGNPNSTVDKFIRNFVDGEHWNQAKLCFAASTMCHHVPNFPLNFNESGLSLVQWYCCRPPTKCRFELTNGTLWMKAKIERNKTGYEDCQTWSNQKNILCYNCRSCRGALLLTTIRKWDSLSMYCALITILLILICSFACCARNNDFKTLNNYLVH